MQDNELKARKRQKNNNADELDERTVRENIISKMIFAADPVNSTDFAMGWPEFPRRFHFFKPAPNVEPFCIEISDDNICTMVTDQDVKDALVKYYMQHILPHYDVKDYKYQSLCDFFLKFRASMQPLTEIKKIAFKSDPALAWHRLDFDPDPKMPKLDQLPNFKSFYIDRMSNAKAVCAYIGSLFIDSSDRSQYVWMFGSGKNGKGRLANFLERILGEASVPFIVPKKQAGKGHENLVAVIADKRLAICEDCGEYYFVTDAFFKRLTGGGTQMGEIKYRMAAKMKIDTKFWFDSNEEPGIKGSPADLRRCIYSTLPPLEGVPLPQAEMDALLWEERQAIISLCIATYKRLCPKQIEPIPADHEEMMALVENNEEELMELADKFVFSDDLWCPAPDVTQVLRSNGAGHPRSKLAREFKKYVERLGAKPSSNNERKTVAGRQVRFWRGMALATQSREF